MSKFINKIFIFNKLCSLNFYKFYIENCQKTARDEIWTFARLAAGKTCVKVEEKMRWFCE